MKKIILAALLLSHSAITNADDRFSAVEIKVHQANNNVYMLTGAGGNIGVLATNKGLLLVDDQFEPLAEKIEQAMSSISDQSLKYIVNTHLHGDHTGGNSHFSQKAPIFAHQNVRSRLAKNDDLPDSSLPVVTYEDGVTIHLDQEVIKLIHLAKGHTDGDTVVYFKHANVLHTGDLYFQGRFPYVDLKNGGSVKGYLANVNYMINNMPDDVIIIPGHGVMSNKVELKYFATMIAYSIDRVEKALGKGMSRQEILAMGIGDKYKDMSWRFITEEKWLNTLIDDLQ